LSTDNNKQPKIKYNLTVVFATAITTFLIGSAFVVFLSLNIKANNTNKDLFLSNLYSSVVSQIQNTNDQTNSDQKQNKIQIAEAVKITFEKDQIKQTEDIYQKVKEKDDIWSEMTSEQTIKIRFEKPLTNQNDITIFARSLDLENQPINVQVYAKYQHEQDLQLVAVFNEIKQARSHKVLLTNLREVTDTFYLKTDCAVAETAQSCGILEIDYITDPTEGGITISSGVKIGSGISMGIPSSPAPSCDLIVTGSISPDASGCYIENGTHNGQLAYEKEDGSYWIYYESGGSWQFCWIISVAKGGIYSGGWYRYYSGIIGGYTPVYGTAGTASVSYPE
jgi:hypothetical protein